MSKEPVLYIVIPCYNEEDVLVETMPMFQKQLISMIRYQGISKMSRILFVDDGSTDHTWQIIEEAAKNDDMILGIKLSTNCGHQNALFAGLMHTKGKCDITISIDCDGQDDITVMEDMINEYKNGCDVVYGVRDNREEDTIFKRWTAESYYKLLERMGAKVIYNHADYRLLSNRVLDHLSEYKETNLFLRGLIPMIGFKSTNVYYKRTKRIAGETHYPLKKMISLAITGITNVSIKPIELVFGVGGVLSLAGFLGFLFTLFAANPITMFLFMLIFLSGLQVLCIGIVGVYVGKTYMETKHRPKYIIEEVTDA